PTHDMEPEGRHGTRGHGTSKGHGPAMKRQNRLRRVALAWAALALAAAGLVAGAAMAGAGRTAAPPGEPPGHRIALAVPDRPPISLYYENDGQGPPVLLLHGLGESTFTWHEIVPRLAERHRVIALDLKGFGRSDKPGDEAYGADDQAALVAQFLIALNLDAVSVVGH